MIENPIIACYAGPETADAVHLGAALARAARQPLVVTSAFRYDPGALGASMALQPGNERRFDAAEARVAQALGLVDDDLEVRHRVLPADGIAEALTDLAREEDACALVLGRDLNGTTLRSVLEQTPCPVAVSPYATPLAGSSDLRVIGVAYDGSPGSRFALAAALRLAALVEARVRLIAVGLDAEEAADDAAARDCRGIGADVLPGGGEPGPGLVAASAGVDALFCGSRGRGRVLSAVLGSVSGRLVREAHCPVMVVGPRVRLRPGAPLGLTTAAG